MNGMPVRAIDETHDPSLTSWVDSANEPAADFPVQNLPFGRFHRVGVAADASYIGVAIGDHVLDIAACARAGLLSEFDSAVLTAHSLNALLGWPVERRVALRRAISRLLIDAPGPLRDDARLRTSVVRPQSEIQLMVPCQIGNYSDFYASIYHATNVGSMFRPTNPLLPNYRHIPIGYHGRASSVVVSGTPVRRPEGQTEPPAEGQPPRFGPTQQLDYELEIGAFVSVGNPLGEPIGIDQAEDYLFGVVLVNDWSARDIQRWEYQPLGPFLAKSFATTVSPWVITMEALAPFRVPPDARAADDPPVLAYLAGAANQSAGAIDLELEVLVESHDMRERKMAPLRLSTGNLRHLYWTLAQMVTHHASNGCNLLPGDLIASGTVSGPQRDSRGCLLELTWDGEFGRPVPGSQRTPIVLPTGEQRLFLADGDEVTLRGRCRAEGRRPIGLGQCRGRIEPATP